jgi:hypothetical protein
MIKIMLKLHKSVELVESYKEVYEYKSRAIGKDFRKVLYFCRG